MIGQCQNCKHWRTDAQPTLWGRCLLAYVPEGEGPPANDFVGIERQPITGIIPHLITGPEFGCVRYSDRPEPKE